MNKHPQKRAHAFLGAVRNGTLLGLVLFAHVVLLVCILANVSRHDGPAPFVPVAPEVALNVFMRDRPQPALLAPARPVEPARAHPGHLASTPAYYRMPAPASAAPRPLAPPAEPSEAPVAFAAPVRVSATPIPSPSAYAGGDPALREALGAGRHTPVGIPGYDAGSRAQGLVLGSPASLGDSLRAVGSTLNCNAIKMQRNKPGNLTSAALDRAYDEMGCTG